MSAKAIYVAQECHVVNLVPPVNVAGGLTSAGFSMKNWRHASIVVQLSLQSAALQSIQLESSDNGSPENTTPIPFNLHKCETLSGKTNSDVLSDRIAVPAAGFAPSGANDIFYVLELDADTLPASQNYVKLVFADNSPAASEVVASAFVILSGGRYEHDHSETVLT